MLPSTERIPEWAKTALRHVVSCRAILYHGNERFCPVCGKQSRRFVRHGLIPREDAECPRCGALERHRFLWLYLLRKTNLFDGTPRKVLHVAPERCLEARLKKMLGKHYVTADLSRRRHPMVKMDITHIEYPDQSFDVIYCSHVLEHVPDDRRAMSEFSRVLKDDGWALLLVPITVEKTFEDPSIIDPKDRLRVFGQADHVRRYGLDYFDRLREAGFSVETIRVSDVASSEEAVRMGLTPACGDIYCCTKAKR